MGKCHIGRVVIELSSCSILCHIHNPFCKLWLTQMLVFRAFFVGLGFFKKKLVDLLRKRFLILIITEFRAYLRNVAASEAQDFC